MEKYSIGIDYGTLSARALLVNLENGKEEASAVFEYPHGVLSDKFINGEKLPDHYALQDPSDYTRALIHTVSELLLSSSVRSEDIVGIGIDFTSCTILPIDQYGTPLCMKEEFKNEPHAYVKLWKHHSAQKYADLLSEKWADEAWIRDYGGKISCEWMLPKIMEIAEEAPHVFKAADRFIEAGDWIVSQLIGGESHSACMAGFKGLWNDHDGYVFSSAASVSKSFDPMLKSLVGTKISKHISRPGSAAGTVTPEYAALTGLSFKTPVSVCIIDAHASLPAAGITSGGKMLMIIGTSTCHILMSEEKKQVSGICGVVKDGLIPGLYCYEAGQAAVGDIFDWFVKNCVPAAYIQEAKEQNITLHQLLRRKASRLTAGESGLLALDWHNGNRSILTDYDLSGLILGLTLNTKPEEIYRALIEATALGSKIIIDNFRENGVAVDELYAAGGIAEKDEMTMQIYADVLGCTIRVCGSKQSGALGSAMFGAVAGGYFPSMHEAAKVMANVGTKKYVPNPNNAHVYEELYKEYKALHDYFGKKSGVMHRLKEIKRSAVGEK